MWWVARMSRSICKSNCTTIAKVSSDNLGFRMYECEVEFVEVPDLNVYSIRWIYNYWINTFEEHNIIVLVYL